MSAELAPASYTLQPLYGGAMEMALPAGLDDVSAIRQVPDNQEVFVDAASDRCVIIELLAYDAELPDSEAAVLHYFADLANHQDARFEHDAPIVLEADATPLIADSATARFFVRGTHLGVAKFKETAGNDVLVHMALLRCPGISTDVLVTQTFPIRVNMASSSAHSMTQTLDERVAAQDFAALLASIKINDFGLFAA